MSLISLASGEPTVTATDLHSAAKTAGFSITPGSVDEKDYLLMQNSFDAIASSIDALPDYIDPRLAPIQVEGGERKWTVPDPASNTLNAWAQKCVLKATNPRSNKLAGKTVAIKANVSVAGAPLDVGTSPELFKGGNHTISTIDATVVRRVLEAGGTILGIGTCENLSVFALSLTSHTGPVRNAWAKGYATGGSTSGCTVLISAKDVQQWKGEGRKLPFPDAEELEEEGVDLAIGGDQGGSIRLPAHYSGIYGIKPTHGLVPYTGIASLHPMIDHTGPMGRSIEDVATFLGVLAGADGIDYRQTPETPLLNAVTDYAAVLEHWKTQKKDSGEWTPTAAAKGLRIGILKEAWEVLGLDTEVGSLVRHAAERFGQLGAEVKEVSVPMHHLGPSIWTVAGREMMPNALSNRAPGLLSHTLPGFEPIKVDQKFYDYMSHRNPAVINVLLNAAHMENKFGPGLTRKTHMLATQLIAAYDQAFEDVDIIVAPVTGKVAPKIPEGITKDGSALSALEMAMTQLGATLNTCPFNLSGHPAMSIPCGWATVKEGTGKLPVGMQLIGKRWHEMDIFKAASAWEVTGKAL